MKSLRNVEDTCGRRVGFPPMSHICPSCQHVGFGGPSQPVSRKLLTDHEVQVESDRLGSIFAVAGELIDARLAAGLIQADISARMGTSQSVVARLESARHMPTFDVVARSMRRRLTAG